MEHDNTIVYYAKRGEYVTLDGIIYEGSFYVKSSGILVTIPTESTKSQVIVPVAGREIRTSEPIGQPSLNTELNENQTEYDLLPVLYNDPPIITSPIDKASRPQIKPSAAAGSLNGNYMYLFPDGAVKVHTGTAITLQVEAQQPPILNVENGVLEIIDPKEGLTYTWLVDGERINKNEVVTSLQSSRVVSGSKVVITNMIPRFAGTYTCVVNNDIGSTDGGTVLLDVYNSDVDSFFYTNLVENPNGVSEDGSLSTDGWSSLSGVMESKYLTKKTVGLIDKKIEIDQMSPNFQWTKEMMHPKPYQLNGGILQNNPLKNLKSYFTRDKYQYTLNGGGKVAQMYQDIDLSQLTDHIKGSIYGVSGVSAVVSFYIGNALWTYEPAYPKLTPPDAIEPSNYNQGAARISLENFAQMGPGFIREYAKITIEEFRDNQRLPSSGGGKILKDPWSRKIGEHSNKVYYPGGRGNLPSPDLASLGDNRDRHLFAADDLMPDQKDRYTYGQYAEFQKIVLPKLNPKTNKIRIIYTIEADNALSGIVDSLAKWGYGSTTDGIYYLNGWDMSWVRGSMAARPQQSSWDDIKKPWIYIKENYRVDEPWPENIEQRVPKQSTSKAFATGFNVTLVPDESDRGVDNSNNIISMQSRNTSVDGLVSSPIDERLVGRVFDQFDTGERLLDVSFVMNETADIDITIDQSRVGGSEASQERLLWSSGLFPFAIDTQSDYINFSPLKITNVVTDTTIEIPPYKVGTIPSTTGYILPPYVGAFPTTKPSEDAEEYKYVQLTDSILDSGNENTAPSYPKDWYTIASIDRLVFFKNTMEAVSVSGSISSTFIESTGLSYNNWAVPDSPIEFGTYINTWNTNQQAFNTTAIQSSTQWLGTSRFIVTIGAHNIEKDLDDLNSLHNIQSYYMDISGNTATLHKTKNLGQQAFLPSFNELEAATEEELELLRSNSNQSNGVSFGNAERIDAPGTVDEYDIFTTEVGDMVPMPIDIEINIGEEFITNYYSRVKIPDSLFVLDTELGGFNVPRLPETLSPFVNIVDATLQFLETNVSAPKFVLEKNKENANNAMLKTIATYIATVMDGVSLAGNNGPMSIITGQKKNYIKAFIESGVLDLSLAEIEKLLTTNSITNYPWGNAPNGPASFYTELNRDLSATNNNKLNAAEWKKKYNTSVQPVRGQYRSSNILQKKQIAEKIVRRSRSGNVPQVIADLVLLYKRKSLINSAYENLLSEMPNNDLILESFNKGIGVLNTATETIVSSKDLNPTLTEMYELNKEINPDYKLLLYGIRPAPLTPMVDFSNKTLSTNTFTGTPLSGEDANNFEYYTVRSINATNKWNS
mgnify:CR=1 FL=1